MKHIDDNAMRLERRPPDGTTMLHENVQAKIAGRDIFVGGPELAVAVYPRCLRNEDDIFAVAEIANRSGARFLYSNLPSAPTESDPRLARRSWIKAFADVRDRFGVSLVSEISDVASLADAEDHADLLHVRLGQSNNQSLLQRLGTDRALLLERAPAMSLEQQIVAAECVIDAGNQNVMLCHSAVLNPDRAAEVDLRVIGWVHRLARLPVLVRIRVNSLDDVTRLSLAAVGSGCDGLIFEVRSPIGSKFAHSQGPPDCEEFERVMLEIRHVLPFVNRTLPSPFHWAEVRPGSRKAAALAAELAPGLTFYEEGEALSDSET